MHRDILRMLLGSVFMLPLFAPEKEGGGAGGEGQGGAGGEGDGGGSAIDQLAGGDKGGEGGADDKGGAKTLTEENWREFLAGDDTEVLAELKRSKTSKDFLGRFKDLRTKVSKAADGDEPAPGKDKPDDLKKWREARGVPLESSGYPVPDDVKAKISDVDKPIVDAFIGAMHEANAKPGEVNTALKIYYDLQEATAADRKNADDQQGADLAKTMRATWGADNTRNGRAVGRAARELIPGVNFQEARMPDGTKLGNIPGVVEFLLEQAEIKWGEGAYEGGDNDGNASLETEMAELKKKMQNVKAWRQDKAGQKRYQELVDTLNKRKGNSSDD